jgi:hypothetical protein
MNDFTVQTSAHPVWTKKSYETLTAPSNHIIYVQCDALT